MRAATIKRELAACVTIARQAYLMRAHGGGNGMSWGLLLTFVLFSVPTWFVSVKTAHLFGVLACIPLGFLAVLWLSFLIGSVYEQNHAAAHALVPRMRGRSLAVLLAGWALLSMGVGFALGHVMGDYLGFLLLAGVAIGAFVAMAFSPIFARSAAVVMVALFAYNSYAPFRSFTATVGDAGMTALSVVMILICILAVARQFGRGRALGTKPGSLTLPTLPFSDPALRRHCASGDRRALLMHVLGPNASMKACLAYAVLALALVGAGAMVVSMPLPVLRVFVIAVVLASQFMAAGRLTAAVYARHKEQSLVRLSAFAPDGRGLNLALAGGLLRAFAGYWVASTVLTLVLALMLGAEPMFLPSLLAVLCMPAMAAAMLLRDFARMEHYGFAEKAVAALWYLGTFALLFMALLGRLGAGWWLAIVVALLLANWVLIRLRKRAMLRARPGFPAGRMA